MEASEPGKQPGRILLIDGDPALGGHLTRVMGACGGFRRYWSRYCGGSHAEPFEVIRDRAGSPPVRSAGASLVTP